MNEIKEKKLAAYISNASNLLLIILKLFAGIVSGSISIISEALHSLSDLFASVITLYSVSHSSEPADEEHPFGHGKYEDISGFVEGNLIILASIYIFIEATKKLITGGNMEIQSETGIYVMAFAMFINIIVSFFLFKIAKKHDSVSLYADAQHLRTDVLSAFGVFVGLIVIKITHLYILDSVIALIIGAFIFKTGIGVSKVTMRNLVDSSLPQQDIDEIKQILLNFEEIKGIKEIKTRRLGQFKKVELTLLFDEKITLAECHTLCDKIEKTICSLTNKISVVIHPEPMEKESCIAKTI